jgi:hypothetical protein
MVMKSFAQDCQVQQRIVDDYTEDAKLLALREIYSDRSHYYADSITIPSDLINNYIDILSVVYDMNNDVTDTLFNLYQIHAFPDIPYMEIGMMADTSYDWINNYLNDSLVSGNSKFDSLMLKYDFKLQSYHHLNTTTFIQITTSDYLNLYPIVDSLEMIQGLSSVSAITSWAGDGNDIEILYRNDTAYVDFSIGWGDCPSGCINRRYWKFAVIECEGVYLGTSGDYFTTIKQSNTENFKIYPNPVGDYLFLEPWNDIRRIDIFSLNGDKIMSMENVTEQINLSKLKTGQYIVDLYLNDKNIRLKMIKR